MEALNTDQLSNSIIQKFNLDLSEEMKGDVVLINSGMFPPLDDEFRVALENLRHGEHKVNHLVVVLETSGGLMETVERLVAVMRTHYKEVSFVIPNFAFSAGTVLALSGDSIYMDYYSVLGPIDPQYRNSDGSPLPGYGYLQEYKNLVEVINGADSPKDCRAELAYLVKKFDPALVFRIEQAVQHGVTLVTEWLPKYKFKDWKKTTSTEKPVTGSMRTSRAREIAEILGDAARWHSHGRGISMKDLRGASIKLQGSEMILILEKKKVSARKFETITD